MNMMTTGGFYMPKETYSTAGATATIEHNGDVVDWSFDHGGTQYTGAVAIKDYGSLAAALHAARAEVDVKAHQLATKGQPDAAPAVVDDQSDETADDDTSTDA